MSDTKKSRWGLSMKGRVWRSIILSSIGASLTVIAGFYVAYSHDMRAIRNRISVESQLIQTSHGLIEFTTWGRGPVVLAVHGAGGGYDQGRLIANAFGGEGFRWIAPSRFGYLRTPLPEDASTTAQADAFAALLDALRIDRVAILAMSGGVPPSLQFAQRYPARVSALVLLSSAPYTPLTAGDQKLPVPIWVYQTLFSSDIPYWVLQKVVRPSLETIFDVTPALRAELTQEWKRFVADMVDGFQPVTQRIDGVRNEGAAIDPNTHYAVDQIMPPTLVIHSRDDGINPFSVGEFTAQHISGAELMPLTTGGHLLLGHQADVRARVNSFLGRYALGASQ